MEPDRANNRPGRYRPPVPLKPGVRRVFPMTTATGAVKPRSSSVVDGDSEILEQGEQFANGDDYLFEIVVSTQSGDRLLAAVEQCLFVDFEFDATTLLPGGSAVTPSQWQVIGPYLSLMKADGDMPEDGEQVYHTYVRNISAGNHAVLLRYRISYIANRGNALA